MGRATLQHPKMPFPYQLLSLPLCPFPVPLHPSLLPRPQGNRVTACCPCPGEGEWVGSPSTRQSLGSRARVVPTPLKTPATGRDKDTTCPTISSHPNYEPPLFPPPLEQKLAPLSSAGLHLSPQNDPGTRGMGTSSAPHHMHVT